MADNVRVRAVLPHDDPFLFIDTVDEHPDPPGPVAIGHPVRLPERLPFGTELDDIVHGMTTTVTASHTHSADDSGYGGHTFEKTGAITPGVQLIELAKQIGMLFFDLYLEKRYRLDEVQDFTFKRPVFPGVRVDLEAQLLDDGWIKVTGTIEGKEAFTGRIRLVESTIIEPTISLEALIEAVAQTLAFIGLSDPANAGKDPLFRAVSMKFKRDIEPWESLELVLADVETNRRFGVANVLVHGEQDAGTELLASGKLTFALV